MWTVESKDRNTQAQISISDKNRDGEYETSWSGYVTLAGGKCTAHQMAKDVGLKKGDRIRLIRVDERSSYNKETKVKSYYHTVFEFEKVDNNGSGKPDVKPASQHTTQDTGDNDPF